MKTYYGRRDKNGKCFVRVSDDGGKNNLLRLRLDLSNHSPTGYEWGYDGSGPAQLALAILADVLKVKSGRTRGVVDRARQAALRMRGDFQHKVIAHLPRNEPWKITEQQVLDFIKTGAVG